MGLSRRPALAAAALIAVVSGGCGSPSAPPSRDVRRVEVTELRAAGLSGSDSDFEGRLWAVAERDRCVYRFEDAESEAPAAMRVALEGVVEGLDLESLAWVTPTRLALGTESYEVRSADLILWAEPAGDVFRIVGSIELSWKDLYDIEAAPNQGIEGLCFAAGVLLAGGEPVIVEGNRRLAPIARRDLREGDQAQWEPFLLRLTSREGKLSSLDCTLGEDGEELDVFAIERHYGVTRVLRFAVPLTGGGDELEPTVVADLDRMDHMPNMEGLSRRRGRLLILTDHDSVTLEGTTETILLGPLDDD